MISIIVAMGKNRVIGKGGEIPWYLPDDLKHFAKITKGHTVIMGRKTYESIVKKLGHPLPERKNIVITSQAGYEAPGCEVVTSVDELVKRYIHTDDEVFVIGGGEIYKQFMPATTKLYVTEVETECEGDTLFPVFTGKDWELELTAIHKPDEKHKYKFTFLEFERTH